MAARKTKKASTSQPTPKFHVGDGVRFIDPYVPEFDSIVTGFVTHIPSQVTKGKYVVVLNHRQDKNDDGIRILSEAVLHPALVALRAETVEVFGEQVPTNPPVEATSKHHLAANGWLLTYEIIGHRATLHRSYYGQPIASVDMLVPEARDHYRQMRDQQGYQVPPI